MLVHAPGEREEQRVAQSSRPQNACPQLVMAMPTDCSGVDLGGSGPGSPEFSCSQRLALVLTSLCLQAKTGVDLPQNSASELAHRCLDCTASRPPRRWSKSSPRDADSHRDLVGTSEISAEVAPGSVTCAPAWAEANAMFVEACPTLRSSRA